MRVSGDAFSIPAAYRANDRAMRARGAQRQMSGLNSALVEHPRVTIVNSLHASSQQATRSDQEWRNDVAKHRRAEQTHERKPERAVVVHCADEDQLFNSLGIVERARCSDSTAVRAADKDCAR